MKSNPSLLELDTLIGQGANGEVYSAWRTDSGRNIRQRVAVKILNSRTLVDIWKDEFASLMRVNSLRCVRVYGFEWIGRRPALILELVEGVDLSVLMKFHQLNRDEILYLIREIGLGLKDLHAIGLCHGDLSPANILVGDDGQIRLVDFGFGNTTRGRRNVTPQFAAPEVLSGEVPNVESDIWSLGALAEHLVRRSSNEELRNLGPEIRNSRLIPEIDYSQEAQLRLASSVQNFRTHASSQKTQALDRNLPKVVLRVGQLALGVCTVFVLAARGSAVAVESRSTRVSVRSNFGLKIRLDGIWQGYAPMDFMGLVPGRHKLLWATSDRSGELTLTLKEGQNIVIDDKSFR